MRIVEDFVKGKMLDYEAVNEFSLNFEDRKLKSVKIKVGEGVKYDGETAIYTLRDGVVMQGRCPSLKGAINLGWLAVKNGKHKGPVPAAPQAAPAKGVPAGKAAKIPAKNDDYDPKLGGNFDSHLRAGGLNPESVVSSPANAPKREAAKVIRQEDNVVKRTAAPAKHELPAKPEAARGREVLKQNVPDRGRLSVNSSTAQARPQTHSREVISSNNAGAQREIPMHNLPVRTAAAGKKRTFTVDASTPNVSDDPMTAPTPTELRRMTSPRVIEAEDSQQEARVVGKVNVPGEGSTTSAEGITFRKTVSREKSATARVGSGSGDINFSAKVTPGEDMPDVGGEARVIKKVGQPTQNAAPRPQAPQAPATDIITAPVAKGSSKADAARAARLASSAGTQAAVAKGKPAAAPKTVPKTTQKAPRTTIDNAGEAAENSDYLLMLPDNWADMHWVQKEKFIKVQTDRGFIEFIATVETVPAVVNACKDRLKKLGF